MTDRLDRSFFARDARVVARGLIGVTLRVEDAAGLRRARIVETEAYRGPRDAACHARFGVTARTRAIFAAPGHAYVFLIYGMYDCFNVTCLAEGSGHAVLVRAAEPLFGGVETPRGDGPGRLTRALGITRAHDGLDLCRRGAVVSLEPALAPRPRVFVTARVGVAYAGADAERPLRFVEAGSPFASRPSPRTIGLGAARGVRSRRTDADA